MAPRKSKSMRESGMREAAHATENATENAMSFGSALFDMLPKDVLWNVIDILRNPIRFESFLALASSNHAFRNLLREYRAIEDGFHEGLPGTAQSC